MSSSSGIRVLYMEDDAGLARLVQKRLSRSGFDVTTASDGQSGLDEYKQNMFDIVAVDQEMPGLKGVDVIRAMSAEKPIPPIIMITGQGDEMLAVVNFRRGNIGSESVAVHIS